MDGSAPRVKLLKNGLVIFGSCQCKAGFVGNGRECEDVNECSDQSARCSVNAGCKNTPGAYVCECNAGFAGDGYSKGFNFLCFKNFFLPTIISFIGYNYNLFNTGNRKNIFFVIKCKALREN